MEGEVYEPGVWMPEQVTSPPRFFSRLARHGLTVEQPAIDDHPGRTLGDASALRARGHHADRR